MTMSSQRWRSCLEHLRYGPARIGHEHHCPLGPTGSDRPVPQRAICSRSESRAPLVFDDSEGEISGLARCWTWGDAKKKSLGELLSELVRFEASLPEVVTAYSRLYFEGQRRGKTTDENDLWIAACAMASNSVLTTCDRYFLWLSPALVRVEHIPKIK
jgi:predicted nucleic acid-binding protein